MVAYPVGSTMTRSRAGRSRGRASGGLPLTARDLSRVTFGHSAVWETVACLDALRGRPLSVHTRTLRRSLTSRSRIAADFLNPLTGVPGWMPEVLTPVPQFATGEVDFDLLGEIRVDAVQHDLERLQRLGPGGPWRRMGAEEFTQRVTEALIVLWEDLLAPAWRRICAVQTADVNDRLIGLACGGLRRTLNELHPSVRFVDSVLYADLGRPVPAPPRSGAGVCLIPSVFRWNSIVLSVPERGPVLLGYPAAGGGSIWEPDQGRSRDLASLIGRTRAAVLTALSEARTTSDLAQEFGFAPSTVSAHLGTLTAAGLVHRRRCGKEVRYVTTTLGGALIRGGIPPRRRGWPLPTPTTNVLSAPADS